MKLCKRFLQTGLVAIVVLFGTIEAGAVTPGGGTGSFVGAVSIAG